MAITNYDLTVIAPDLLGAAFSTTTANVAVFLDTNLGDGEAIIDTISGQIRLGSYRLNADSSGTAVFAGLIGSDSDPEDLNLDPDAVLQYRVRMEYTDAFTRRKASLWTSGWFELTADANLTEITTVQYAPISWQSTFTAAMEAIRDESQGNLDAQELISGLTGEDGAVALLTSTEGTDTRVAIDALIDPEKYASSATAANTKRVMGKLRRAVNDVSILIVSDSTGNATNEWAYLTVEHIADEFPEWTVQTAFWDESSGTAYQSPTTVQTGTNGRTAMVWIASKAGGDPGYFLGSRWDAAIVATSPDLMIMSHGHNMGDPTTTQLVAGGLRNLMAQFTEDFAATFPNVGVVLIAQNPTKQSGRETWQAFRASVFEELASLRGYGFIDVHQAFWDYGDWQTDLMLDDTHPNDAGSAIWAAVVSEAFTDTARPSAMVLPPPPLHGGGRNYLANADFSDWTGTDPASWTPSLATTSKDTTNFESSTQGCKVTGTGSSGIAEITQDVSLTDMKYLRGQLVTLGGRVFVPAANTATVRVAMQDSTGGANIRNSDLPASTRDRYVWVFVTKQIDSSATYIRARLMARTSGTSTVNATFDRAALVRGVLPADSKRLDGLTGATGATGAAGAESASSFDFLSTLGRHPAAVGAAATTSNLGVVTANNAILVPVKAHRAFTLAVLRWVSRTTSGNYDIGIYNNSGTRLWSKGSTAWPTSSTSTAIVESVSPTVALTAGDTYWIAFASDSTAGQLQMMSLVTAVAEVMKLADGTNFARVVASSFPLPSPITIGSTISGRIPAVSLAEA